jgi:hypothetical protein
VVGEPLRGVTAKRMVGAMKDLVLRKYEVLQLAELDPKALILAAQTVFEAETGIPAQASIAVACDHTVSVVGWVKG